MPDFIEQFESDDAIHDPAWSDEPLPAWHDGPQTYIVHDGLMPETKSKDEIQVRFDPLAGADHFAVRFSSVYSYRVQNLTKSSGYTVFFFRAQNGSVQGQCQCVARKICKHILRAWNVHREAITNGFIPANEPSLNGGIDERYEFSGPPQ